jgi:hypothetical protein
MNDLTFATTLLSFLATLVAAVFVQATAAPVHTAEASAVTRSPSSRIRLAESADRGCATVALAPADVR